MMRKILMRSMTALALAGGVLVADDMPFYRTGTTAPVRAAASTATSAQAVELDSRTVQTVVSAAIPFCSRKIQGTILMFR